MAEELYPDVQPGDPISADLFNRLQDFARRKDRLKFGSRLTSTQGHVDTDSVDVNEPILLRANQDVIPGVDEPSTLNATVVGWDHTRFRPIDNPENSQVMLKTYLLPVRKNDCLLAVYSDVARAFVPALTDYVADLMVDGSSSVMHVFGGHIQLPNNNTFDTPFNSPPPSFNAGPNVWLMPTPPTPDPSVGDQVIGHYTGLYAISSDVRPLFRFSAGGVTSGGGGGGTAAVPLLVTSMSGTEWPGGSGLLLYPAVILNYNASTNTFSSSGTNIWAITTNHNTLAVTAYTGIFIGHGGSPARDIYCINDNLVVEDSGGGRSQVGLNTVQLDPPNNWAIAAGAANGEVVIGRVLEAWKSSLVQTYVWKQVYTPDCTWAVTAGAAGVVNIRRLLRVQDASAAGVDDIATITLSPTYTWSWTASTCGIGISRKFEVWGDAGVVQSDVWKEIFTPACTWSLTAGAAGVVSIKRLFVVQTDGAGDPFNDVAGIRFIPDCAWTLATDSDVPCGVTVKRKFTVQRIDGTPPVNDVALLAFTPSNTWTITAGSNCEARVLRIFNVNGNTNFTDVYQITFATADFVLSGSAQTPVVNTKGETKSIYFCKPDGSSGRLDFVDGLLQSDA